MKIWPWSRIADLEQKIASQKSALHRIAEEASSFRGLGGSYDAVDDDWFNIVREMQAARSAIWPDGWTPPKPTGERNWLQRQGDRTTPQPAVGETEP